MVVLHVAVGPQYDGVLFWAEDGPVADWPGRDGPDMGGPESAGQRSRGVPPLVHATGGIRLVELLRRVGGEALAGSAVESEAAFDMPAYRGVALPSPAARSVEGEFPGPDGTVRCRVPVVSLPASESIDVLHALDDPPVGVRVGDSVRWLGTVAALALEYGVAGRLLAGLAADADGRWCARWQVHPDGGDGRLDRLAASAPAALLSHSRAGSPRAWTQGVCDMFCDAAARDALSTGPRPRPARSPAAAWLAALRAADPVVDLADESCESLAAALVRWYSEPAADMGRLRTCFRLTPPELDAADAGDAGSGADAGDEGAELDAVPTGDASTEAWTVELMLQAMDDPSLLFPAADVWSAPGTLTWLDRTFEHPQDRLLTDLGNAVRLWPGLDGALAEEHPARVVLETAAALDFLRDVAPRLEAAGFGVLVPRLGSVERVGLRLRARPAATPTEGTGLLGGDALCSFEWQVAVGDDALTEEELHSLARLKQPLVRHRGRWVQVDVDAVESAVKFLESGRHRGEVPSIELIRTGLGLQAAEVDLPVLSFEAEGWLAELLDGDLSAAAPPAAAPAGFRGDLRPYQERGLGWLRFLAATGLGGCLADDMGLGKTVQVLALLAAEKEGATSRAPSTAGAAQAGGTLLVCPTSVVTNWCREADKFTPSLTVATHHGPGRARDAESFAAATAGADVVVTTYGVAARDSAILASLEWRRVVIDEAQLVKNAGSQQARAVRSIPARHRLALTGTPVENRLSELWSIMEFANPGLLGSAAGFRRTFSVPIERYRDDDAAALLGRLVRPFVLRRRKTDPGLVDELPDKVEETELCALTREQATLYQSVVTDMLEQIAAADREAEGGVRRRGLVLATMAKLKAVCNHPAQLLGDGSALPGRSGKLTRLEEIAETVLAAGEHALVFTQFAEFGGRLRRHLEDTFGIEVPFLHGGVTRARRDRMVEVFQAGDGPPLMLVSLKAGGVGLNLTAANNVIHFDRWWNPAVEDQATDRAYRIGQRRDVLVRRFVCRGTLEERIDEVLAAKRDLADRVIAGGEDWLTDLSVEELREVVRLAVDAVEDVD